jgi:hypothetical protein
MSLPGRVGLSGCNQEIQHSIRDIDTHATHTYQSTSDYEQRLKGRTYQVARFDSCHGEIGPREKRRRIAAESVTLNARWYCHGAG